MGYRIRAAVRSVIAGLACAMILTGLEAAPALAAVSNAAPVKGEISYAVPMFAVLGFGAFGLFVLYFAFACPRRDRPYLLLGGSVLILSQYLAIMIDMDRYGEAFAWYDAFLLPPYCVFHPASYSRLGHVFGLVLPCVFIMASTVAIPVSWVRYLRPPAAGKSDANRYGPPKGRAI